MSPIIEVKGLSKHFRDVTAVDNLSFTVQEGEVYGFLGQNGAGKSTTIRMLLTLIEPSSGSIEMFGMDLKKHRREILKQVGAIIERPDLYKYLTAMENLRIFSTMSGVHVTEKNLIEQLELVGLSERAHSKVKTYSQGMRQRLGIATALVHDPRLIILDEPINGLDPQGIADVRNLILDLSKRRKKTVFVSSHLLSEIELVADSMLIIDKGKKMAEGKVSNLFDPADTLVELETTDKIDTIEKLQHSDWKEYLIDTRKDKILFRMHRNKVPRLTRSLVEMKVEIISIHPQHSLEDYFIAMTSGKQHVETFKD
jgi:ABC-2 type transport system ATP-binding protein